MKKTERIIFCCSPEERSIIDRKVSDGHFTSIRNMSDSLH